MKKTITTLVLTSLLLLSGCDDTKGEGAYANQYNLDHSNYAEVIADLKDKTNKSSEELMLLASAYMGNSGLGLSSLLEIVVENENDGGDEFASFAQKVGQKSSNSAVADTSKAIDHYNQALYQLSSEALKAKLLADGNRTMVDCEADSPLSDTQKDVCLYISISNLTKSSVLLSLIADDLSALGDEHKEDPKMKASSCAMEYAFSTGTYDTKKCTIGGQKKVVFDENGRAYDYFTMSVSGKSFGYLQTGKYTALTKGFCTLDSFASRRETPFSGGYVCPVSEVGDEITVLNTLTTTINSGLDSAKVADDEEMREDIEDFREDIKGNEEGGDVSEEELIDYLGDEEEN